MDINCTERELFVFKKIAHAAQSLQMPCYVIGGFVRDKILGRATKDADIVCVGDGIELANKVADRFQPRPFITVFKNFGTAQIKISSSDQEVEGKADDVFEIEFVGARKESYRYHSRNPSVSPGTLEDDQRRRDFTINALAISLNEADYGKLMDPFHGLRDLSRKLIQTPLDPLQTFSDDPLRMLRAIRFATQLNFNIEAKTLAAIKEDAHRIRIVSQERITDELNKIILTKKPSVGFDLLYQTALLH
ncbi:MAG TPA: CCA tRNA nucleotidyltransferase, partial [Puia sp.]|nr:CCA tRNA nucleotidyltransferase [Puia sp.]